jgi:carboxymethylenebutenolidase
MRIIAIAAVWLLGLSCSSARQESGAGTVAAAPPVTAETTPPVAAATPARDPNLPPSEDQAKAALETSSRHGEYVDVKGASAPIRTYVVYPERADKAGAVIIVHEIFGLSDWIRGVADQLARDGFIAVAPDLISGLGPGGGGTDSVASRDEVVKLVRGLSAEEATARLDAVHAYAVGLPAANGKSATIGFCWGGARSFAYAAAQPALDAAVVYYGSSPDSAVIVAVGAPVQGHYGGDDARVNATIEPARNLMQKGGKSYEAHLYPGAGHGFLRQQIGREGANLEATRQSWPRTLAFLRERLR